MPKNITNATSSRRGPFARVAEMFRNARLREAEALIERYAGGRWTDAAEREMSEKLLHRGDTFRF